MENMVEQTSWEEIGISNDFLFGKIMQNPDLCIQLLQRILPELEIDHIEYPELQKSIKPDADARSVRLDVYVKDRKETVYDIEMQVGNTKELAKRSRYYQGMIDLQLLDKGQSYKRLNQSYVIFICPFDMFGKGRHIYTFEYLCREDKSIAMGDGATKIFLNAVGTQKDVSMELEAFLDYVAGKKSEDAFVKKLEEAVKKAKKNRKWRHEFMTLAMRDLENVEKGREEGIKEGIKKGIKEGIKKGRKEGKIENTVEMCQDFGLSRREAAAKLIRKFGLTESEASGFVNQYWKS